MKKIVLVLIRWLLLLLGMFIVISGLYRLRLHQKALTKVLEDTRDVVKNLTQLRTDVHHQEKIAQDPILADYEIEKVARQELSMAQADEIIYIIKRP